MFVDCCLSNGLQQLVREVTRPTQRCQGAYIEPNLVKYSGSIIDLLLTTDPDIIAEIRVSPSPISSDHKAITFDILFEPDPPPVNPKNLNFRKADYEAIVDVLFAIPWRSLFSRCSDVNEMYSTFLNSLHQTIDTYVPKRVLEPKNRSLVRYIRKLEKLMEKSPNASFACKLRKAATRLRLLGENPSNTQG